MFLDYFNNYLSYEQFAEHNNLEESDAIILIEMGRRYHEDYVLCTRHMEEKRKEFREIN
jgi:hypothetical protein